MTSNTQIVNQIHQIVILIQTMYRQNNFYIKQHKIIKDNYKEQILIHIYNLRNSFPYNIIHHKIFLDSVHLCWVNALCCSRYFVVCKPPST